MDTSSGTKEVKNQSLALNLDEGVDIRVEHLLTELDVHRLQVIVTYTFFTRISLMRILSTEFPKYRNFWVEKLFDPSGKEITQNDWNDAGAM